MLHQESPLRGQRTQLMGKIRTNFVVVAFTITIKLVSILNT